MKQFTMAVAACLAVILFSIIIPTAQAANTYLTNPFGIAYRYTTNVEKYGRPGGMVIAGNCNRHEAAFANARANGAEILVYIDPVEVYDYYTCAPDADFYTSGGSTPLWPYPSAGQRVNYPATHLTDIRKGSAWSNRVVAYVEKLMRENKVDGVFLDVVGGRLWTSLANWNAWPQWEKDQWTDGNVDLVRRLDASRRAINPRFIIVNNNMWDRGDNRGSPGESYVDGIVIEHHASTSAYHRSYAGRPFSNLGHRRVLVIANSTAEAQAWTDVQGVTHVSDQPGTAYASASVPPVTFEGVVSQTTATKRFGRTSIASVPSSGMSANYKRGSKFTLSERGTIQKFSAYLDGQGGAGGSQSIRIGLYSDNNGVPGTRVTQSSPVTITAGSAGRWVDFPVSTASLNAGNYWIVIHSGGTAGIVRNRGDGSANWYGAVDGYSDGMSSAFGTGSTGTVTLSVNVTYTTGN